MNPPASTMRIILGLALFLGALGSPLSAAPSRPKVLFIAIDDLNHWVGHLGRNAQTRTPTLTASQCLPLCCRSWLHLTKR